MSGSLPDGFTVTPDQAGPPAGFTIDPDTGHAVAGPSGNALTDAGRFLGTAALHVANGLMSPIVGYGGVSVDPSRPGLKGLTIAPPATAQQTEDAKTKFNDNLFNAAGATEYQPSTEGGKVGMAATSGIIGSLLGGGPLAGAAGGAGAQLLSDNTNLPPLAAALMGSVGGAKGANMASRAAGSMMPGAIDAETLGLARQADAMGIKVPLAKISNSPFVRYLDSTVRRMPFSGYGPMDEANQTAVNRNVVGAFGENASKMTPEVINNAYDRMGTGYDDVASRTNIPVTPQLMNDLQGVVDNSRLNMSADSVVPVERQAMNVLDTAANNNGVLGGKQFKDLTAKGGPISTLQSSTDSGLRQAGDQLRGVLQSHLTANATPEDVAQLRQLDTQYKALKTVEPMAMRADTIGGATPSTGDVSPAGLLSRVNQSYTNAARAEPGQIPLKDIAQVAQRFLKEPNSSLTAERSGIQGMMDHGGQLASGIGAAIMGHEAGVPLHVTLPSLAAAMVGPRLIGSYLRSEGPVQNALYGQSLSPLAQALMVQQRLNGAAPATIASSPQQSP